MLRELQVNVGKNVPATYTVKVDMVTGMGVQLNLGSDSVSPEIILPTSNADDNIYFLEREREVTGLKTSLTDIDDYDTDFVTAKKGTYAQLITPYPGEFYGTDQVTTGDLKAANIGKAIAPNTDGKWKVLSSGSSRFVLSGIMQDGTHQLAIIHVLLDPKAVG